MYKTDGEIDDTISPLTRIAKENGYIIHDVPGDGDCLVSSIACQLQSYNIDKHACQFLWGPSIYKWHTLS